MKYAFVLGALALLVGCVASKPNRVIGPHGPVMRSCPAVGSPTRLVPGVGCSDVDNPDSPIADFELKYSQSLEDVGVSNNATHVAMMKSGFVLAELACDRYFTVIANRNQDLGYGIEVTALGAGATAGVLELTGSPAKSIALTAAGFAITLAGMESFQEHYYFGPRVLTVKTLVMDGMETFKVRALTDTSTLDHFAAISRVRQMQGLCQIDSIQRYVDDAVSKAEIVFPTTYRDAVGGEEREKSDAPLNAFGGLDALNLKLANTTGYNLRGRVVSADQLAYLVWLYRLHGTGAPEVVPQSVQVILNSIGVDDLVETKVGDDDSAVQKMNLDYRVDVLRIYAAVGADNPKSAQWIRDRVDQLSSGIGGTAVLTPQVQSKSD